MFLTLDAVELKLGLEKSFENEKTNAKQKAEELQASLNREKEERRKEKEEASSRYDTLNRRFEEAQVNNILPESTFLFQFCILYFNISLVYWACVCNF